MQVFFIEWDPSNVRSYRNSHHLLSQQAGFSVRWSPCVLLAPCVAKQQIKIGDSIVPSIPVLLHPNNTSMDLIFAKSRKVRVFSSRKLKPLKGSLCNLCKF